MDKNYTINIATNGANINIDYRDIMDVTTIINPDGNVCIIKLIDGTLIETFEVDLNAELKRLNAVKLF